MTETDHDDSDWLPRRLAVDIVPVVSLTREEIVDVAHRLFPSIIRLHPTTPHAQLMALLLEFFKIYSEECIEVAIENFEFTLRLARSIAPPCGSATASCLLQSFINNRSRPKSVVVIGHIPPEVVQVSQDSETLTTPVSHAVFPETVTPVAVPTFHGVKLDDLDPDAVFRLPGLHTFSSGALFHQQYRSMDVALAGTFDPGPDNTLRASMIPACQYGPVLGPTKTKQRGCAERLES